VPRWLPALRPLYWLLAFVPASFALELAHASPTWVFLVSCAAILPLAGLLGEATEQLTEHTGPTLGGLLNATFGNAAELIIGFIALRSGELEIVKASLTGSIIGNLLVVLGLAILVGGWRRQVLRFNRLASETSVSMLFLAVASLVVPAIFALVTEHRAPGRIETLSLVISCVLILSYAANLLFSLKTHRQLFPLPGATDDGLPEGPGDDGDVRSRLPRWPVRRSLIVLGVAAVLIGFVSEFLVGAVGAAGEALGFGRLFMGVVVIALIGNAAEHSTAVTAAIAGDIDLAFSIALGSSIQVALFVAPVLVLVGHAIGVPLGLEFTVLEVAAVMLSVTAVSTLVRDGEANWLEGAQLVATYVILAIAFYYL
jgi:Ca2+:H+ antiporter